MTKTDQYDANGAQRRIARKYRVLGYDVIQNPSPDHLPDFMSGVTPDIVARSKADNVVIEVKNTGSLKGSNDMVAIADRISGHPEWRFELIVDDDEKKQKSPASKANFEQVVEKARTASGLRLHDLAYVYLSAFLVDAAREIASVSGVNINDKGDKALFHDLGFKGVIPGEVMEACLAALSVRNLLAHASDDAPLVSEKDVNDLLDLCEDIRALR